MARASGDAPSTSKPLSHSYILEADTLTGPWRMVSYMAGFGEQACFLNFPDKFISKDGRTLWQCYSATFTTNNGKKSNGIDLKINPPGGRCGLSLHEVKLLRPNDSAGSLDSPPHGSGEVLAEAGAVSAALRIELFFPDVNSHLAGGVCEREEVCARARRLNCRILLFQGPTERTPTAGVGGSYPNGVGVDAAGRVRRLAPQTPKARCHHTTNAGKGAPTASAFRPSRRPCPCR